MQIKSMRMTYLWMFASFLIQLACSEDFRRPANAKKDAFSPLNENLSSSGLKLAPSVESLKPNVFLGSVILWNQDQISSKKWAEFNEIKNRADQFESESRAVNQLNEQVDRYESLLYDQSEQEIAKVSDLGSFFKSVHQKVVTDRVSQLGQAVSQEMGEDLWQAYCHSQIWTKAFEFAGYMSQDESLSLAATDKPYMLMPICLASEGSQSTRHPLTFLAEKMIQGLEKGIISIGEDNRLESLTADLNQFIEQPDQLATVLNSQLRFRLRKLRIAGEVLNFSGFNTKELLQKYNQIDFSEGSELAKTKEVLFQIEGSKTFMRFFTFPYLDQISNQWSEGLDKTLKPKLELENNWFGGWVSETEVLKIKSDLKTKLTKLEKLRKKIPLRYPNPQGGTLFTESKKEKLRMVENLRQSKMADALWPASKLEASVQGDRVKITYTFDYEYKRVAAQGCFLNESGEKVDCDGGGSDSIESFSSLDYDPKTQAVTIALNFEDLDYLNSVYWSPTVLNTLPKPGQDWVDEFGYWIKPTYISNEKLRKEHLQGSKILIEMKLGGVRVYDAKFIDESEKMNLYNLDSIDWSVLRGSVQFIGKDQSIISEGVISLDSVAHLE